MIDRIYLVFEEKSSHPSKVEFNKAFKSIRNAEKYRSTLKNRSFIREVELEE